MMGATTTDSGTASRQSEIEMLVRRSFGAADPEIVGAFAALLLQDAIELRSFDLLGEEAFDHMLCLPAEQSSVVRQQRLVALAGTPFAVNVARLVRFAQTGEVSEDWSFGWWGKEPRPFEAVQHTAAVLLQALLVRPLGPVEGYEDGWWTDPGPIDLTSHSWELVTALHLVRERLLQQEGRPVPPLRFRIPRRQPGSLPC